MFHDIYIPPIVENFPKSQKYLNGIYGFYGKIDTTNSGIYEPINEYGFLSNMVVFDKPIEFQNIAYYSVENFYVAMKTLSIDIRKKISRMDPKKAKVYGRTLKVRPDWEEVKYSIILYALREKFKKEPYKSRLLLTSGMYIEETNWWKDKYFGVNNGYGYNILGFLIQHVRLELELNRTLSFTYSHPQSGLFLYLR